MTAAELIAELEKRLNNENVSAWLSAAAETHDVIHMIWRVEGMDAAECAVRELYVAGLQQLAAEPTR